MEKARLDPARLVAGFGQVRKMSYAMFIASGLPVNRAQRVRGSGRVKSSNAEHVLDILQEA